METTGAVNDFIRETARYYPSIAETDIRVVLIHPDSFLLPELGEELGLYAERKLRERKVDVVKGVRVASYDGSIVTLTDGTSIPASTLIWTAGVKPSAVIASLPCEKERGRVRVNEYLAVPGVERRCGQRAIALRYRMSQRARCAHRRHNTVCGKAWRPRKTSRLRLLGRALDAISVQSDGTLGQHRAPHWRGDGVRDQVLWIHRLVVVADRLPGEASWACEEAQSDGGLDAGSVLRKRDRADDHGARRRTAERSARATSQ